ncbi:hypothetical protein EVAR_103109_1 [Eumeta japonica]|uniref:Uncharacterized protein n=1 Tax=Eumeta variegata TaxID=151549 RepID=A0A4C1X3E7_EUMVA|nr:hypothetical protein EVAR_103109_1 [Eumeta japonica]
MGDVELTLQQSAGLLRCMQAASSAKVATATLGDWGSPYAIHDRTLVGRPEKQQSSILLFEALPYSAIDTVDLLYGRVMFSEPILVVWYYVVYF